METFSLKVKLAIVLNGRRLVLERRLLDRRLLWVDELGEPLKMTEAAFYTFYNSRALTIDEEQPHLGVIPTFRNAPPDLSCFPDSHSFEACRRRSYIKSLINIGTQKLPVNALLAKQILEVAKDLNDIHKPPSVSTVRRWFKKYRADNIVRLVPNHAKKGRHRVISGELEELVLDVINTGYLKLERPLLSTVSKDVEAQIDAVNASRLPSQHLRIPSVMSIRRYVACLDPYLVDKGRLGVHAANQNHRAAIGKLVVKKILDRWEIDHTPLDVLVVDPDTGKHIGRPFLTIVLDRHSRVVMAYLIHFSAPNTESVLRVIERAIRPKADLLSRFPKVLNEWRAHGLPARIVPDNAAEFHAGDLVNAFNELGIEIMYPASRAPQKKGGVERFFRTLSNDLIHRLPGTTFSNPRERGNYPSEARACLTLVDLESALVKWIVDVYHQRPHKELDSKRSPAQAWLHGESQRHICLPTDLDALESILARRKDVQLHHYGVEIGTHVYHSPELAELRLRLQDKEKIQVRYRDELGHVWVHDRFRNVFIQVPAKDKRLIGMSRETYDLARARLREAGMLKPTFEAVHQAYSDIMTDVEEAKRSQKMRKRREAAKVNLDRSGSERTALPAPAPMSVDFLQSPERLESLPDLPILVRAPRVEV